MTRTYARISTTEIVTFKSALHLYPTVAAVLEHNIHKLNENGQPIAKIKALHSGPNAAKATSDDAGGLDLVLLIAQGARVMLTANLWVAAGLVNGTMGTIVDICYLNGSPPDLPVAVMIKFDKYCGPYLSNHTVPICPIRHIWYAHGAQCSRTQLPFKLAWAVTIHKAQGLTLDQVVINVGKKEFSLGLTFVACSRVRKLTDLIFDPPFPFERLSNLANSQRLLELREEDARLSQLEQQILQHC